MFMYCSAFLFLPLKVVTFPVADCSRVTWEFIKIMHSSAVKIKIMLEWVEQGSKSLYFDMLVI